MKAMYAEPAQSSSLLSEAAAAAQLGLPAESLRYLRRQGRIGYVRFGPRIVRYRQSDLDAYIEQNAVRPVAAMPRRSVR